MQRPTMKRWSAWVVGIMMWTMTASASTRPISIGLNANWDHWMTRSANVGWVRVDFGWDATEPSPGVFDFSYTDGRVDEAEQNGLQILAILHYVPAWASGTGCGNVPPYTTTDWEEFVRQLAIRYSGRIAAYEIWNEPDTSGTCSSDGIGWGRNVEEPPLYTDFVHVAAQQIRAYSPGSLVVAPAYRTRNDGSGSQADNRKRRFFQQMNAAVYPDGNGPDFVDVTSFHNNAGTTEPSKDMGAILNSQNLSYLSYVPILSSRPIWVTEYGWKSNQVTNDGQREKECNETKIYTGLLEASYTHLDNWNIERSFIFLQKDPCCSSSIFNGDYSPKPVVTQYLQKLAYPAVQQPAFSADYPNCNGTSLLQPGIALTAVRAEWKEQGLQDPSRGLPKGFAAFDAESSGTSVYQSYKRADGAIVSVGTRPAEADDVQFISDSAAEWNHGDTHISIAHVAGPEPGKGWARTLAASVDANFAQAYVEDRLLANEEAVRRAGFHTPAAPKGFAALENRLELTRMSGGCAAAQAATPKNIDFVWSFIGSSGEIVRAGIYRYGEGFQGEAINPASLHWSDARGTRYWVAADPKEKMTPALEDTLYSLARSIDPSFVRAPRKRDSRTR